MLVLESQDMSCIVLASASPRRREVLEWSGWEYILQPADVDEAPLLNEPPQLYVSRLAETKARAAARIQAESQAPNGRADLILAADTTVADGNEVLGKPVNTADARRMLKQLRARSHKVFTALAIYRLSDQAWFFDRCCSVVTMRDYSDEELEDYISTGDAMDKAGAYAIQNRIFQPTAGFNGCFANVIGLPLCHLVRMMRKIGYNAPIDAALACQKHLEYDCPVSHAILAGLDVG